MAVDAATRTARRRETGIDVRPDSVLAARLGAGMSLAQLSRGVVTKGALHLIERGKARPSRRVLEAIAERTGKPLSFFLAPHEIVRLKALTPDSGDLGLANLELLYERDLYADCLREASEMAERWRNTAHEVGARYWRARALIMTGVEGAAQEAIEEARWVLDRSRGGDDAAMLTEALDCLASAQYAAQANDGALQTATEALETARLIQPPNPRLLGKVLAHLAGIHVARHDWDAALKAYADAGAALDGLTDLARSAQMYEGMALAHTNLGNIAEALRYSHRAISLYSRRNERLSLANARCNLGWLLLNRGDLEAADGQLQESERLFQGLGVRQRIAALYHSFGELRLRQGRMEEAAAAAREALDLAQAQNETSNAAVAHILQARIAERNADQAEADRNYQEAIALLSSTGETERLIEAHSTYAEVLRRRGDSAKAAEHYKAALSLARPTLDGRGRSSMVSTNSSDTALG